MTSLMARSTPLLKKVGPSALAISVSSSPWVYYQIDSERGHLIGDVASKADQSVPWPTSLPGLACLRGASCGHMPVRRNGPQCSDPPRTPPRSPLPPHRSPWPPQRQRGFAVGHEEPSPSRVPPLQRTGSFDLVELFGTVQVFS